MHLFVYKLVFKKIKLLFFRVVFERLIKHDKTMFFYKASIFIKLSQFCKHFVIHGVFVCKGENFTSKKFHSMNHTILHFQNIFLNFKLFSL